MKSLMERDGIFHKKGGGFQKVNSYVGIRPLVGYDTNINSGIPAEEFVLGDFTFRTNEEDQAKEGFTVGALVMGSVHYSVAPAHVLKLSAHASVEYAPEHDLSKFAVAGSSCLSSHVKSYTWLDSCAGFRVAEKENASVEEPFLSFGGSQAFATDLGHHEAVWNAKRTFRSDYSKNYFDLGLRSAIPDVGALYTGITWGEEVDGFHTTLGGASVALTRPIMDRKTTISASYVKSGGGTHFGLPRSDDGYTVKVRSQVHENLAVSLGYTWNNSNIDMYNDESVIFGVDLQSWRF
ncbi:hypothetical protein [Sulfitobacter sp. R18_1]|uniref:hypothetical protein n=1 Tax=Sulfitobacter sp. R18_1 TaxID=2821104 RepID=UPI001ADD3323|nr:hypothetical protein [Sulfitobacter sp. R18_1]MBO9428563.1 hypothetical protein [Sulfitobacter sp. R18_1]